MDIPSQSVRDSVRQYQDSVPIGSTLPDRVAVDEKQIQLENEQKVWLYVATDVDSKVVHEALLSNQRR